MCALTKPAEYADAKGDMNTVLKELEDFITVNCTHGAKKPLSHQVVEGESPAIYCCLRCAVDFIWKQRARSKIIQRS
jgi:hypothetical protein